MIAFEPER